MSLGGTSLVTTTSPPWHDKTRMAKRFGSTVRTEHQQRIDAFMRLADQYLPSSPVVSRAVASVGRELRARLIFEEAMETINDLGVVITFELPEGKEFPLNDPFAAREDRVFAHSYEVTPYFDLVGVVDGCADISVVSIGTLSAFGVSDSAILLAVDENNLAKFGPGHSYSAQGKLIKPPDHSPPPIREILVAQGWDLDQEAA